MAKSSILLIFTATALLTACGGGGGGGSSSGTSTSGGATTSQTMPSNSGTTTTSPGSTVIAHTLQLSWSIPTTRANGAPLAVSELASYQIYYFLEGSPPNSGETVNIGGGSTTSTQITINGSGTYNFAITARDIDGLLSELSNYVSVTLN